MCALACPQLFQLSDEDGHAYLLSEDCAVNGEIFAVGGGRIARMTIAENEGAIGSGTSIEEVRAMMPQVMTDERFFYPKDLGERSAKVAALFGFDGRLSSATAFAVKSIAESEETNPRRKRSKARLRW